MEKVNNKQFYFQMFRPWELLLNAILYLMGAGLSEYFGNLIDWGLIFKGLSLVCVIQIAGFSLSTLYDLMSAGFSFKKEPWNIEPDNPRNQGRIRMLNTLLVTITSFSIAAFFLTDFILREEIDMIGILIIVISIMLFLIYSIPPFRASKRGYGEVILGVEGAYLIPVVGYLLQSGENHRILVLIAIPMTLLYLAMEMIRSLQGYSIERPNTKTGRMVSYLGPQKGLIVINIFIITAYLLVAIMGVIGLSWSIVWRFLLTLPVGFFLIWQIIKIRDGGKPNWQLLDMTAISMVGLTAYFVAMGLWLG
jgi:1,4-dihydroxy-2-naphthoate octaprenyltransferase